jgi:hypothetical protein
MSKQGFFDVPRTYYMTSHTRTQIPMFFFNVAVRIINYFVDYDKAEKMLEGTGVVPVRFFNGKAMVSMVFYNYQNVTIGPYDEVTITIMSYPETLKKPRFPFSTILFKKRGKNWGNLGVYILEMPVTIPAARAAGREIWGYPKFLTKIPFKLSGNYFEFSVKDPDTGESIVSVKGEMGLGLKFPAFDFVSYTNYEGAVWKTIIDVDSWNKNCLPKNVEVKVSPGKHRMAQNIRALGLDKVKPFSIMSSDKCSTKLNAGRPVAPWKTRPLPYEHEAETAYNRESEKKVREAK